MWQFGVRLLSCSAAISRSTLWKSIPNRSATSLNLFTHPYQQIRNFHPSVHLFHGDDEDLKDVPDTIKVTFVTKDGEEKTVMAKEGERALYLAHRLYYF